MVPISAVAPGPSEAPSLPADSASTANAGLDSAACQASGSCVAVRYYVNTNGHETTLEVPITNDVPAAGVQTLSADANTSDPGANLSNVACPVSGACEAIGYYYNSSGDYENMVVPISGGAPGTATAVTPPANHYSGNPYVDVEGLSCSSASLCVAAGYYYNSGLYRAAALTLITSTGAISQATSLPDDASQTYPESEFAEADSSAVSGVPSGPCLATGYYYTNYASYSESRLAQEVSASGQVGAAVATPSLADSSNPELYGGTACDAAGSCVATGDYVNSAGVYELYEVTEQAPPSVSTPSLPAGPWVPRIRRRCLPLARGGPTVGRSRRVACRRVSAWTRRLV